MRSEEVSKLLNFEHTDFTKIEESIAGVLGLQKDVQGNYEYEKSHLQALKEVFLNAEADVSEEPVHEPAYTTNEQSGFVPLGAANVPKADASELMNNRPKSIPLVPPTDDFAWALEKMNEIPIPAEPPIEYEPELHGDKEIKSPMFERVDRDGSPITKDPSEAQLSDMNKLLDKQRQFFEKRLLAQVERELNALREDNIRLRKELNRSCEESATLRNIVRNQNDDKLYLIDKLQQKYSLWSMFQWHTNKDESQSLSSLMAED